MKQEDNAPLIAMLREAINEIVEAVVKDPSAFGKEELSEFRNAASALLGAVDVITAAIEDKQHDLAYISSNND